MPCTTLARWPLCPAAYCGNPGLRLPSASRGAALKPLTPPKAFAGRLPRRSGAVPLNQGCLFGTQPRCGHSRAGFDARTALWFSRTPQRQSRAFSRKRQGFGLAVLFLLCRPIKVDIVPESWDNEPCFEITKTSMRGGFPALVWRMFYVLPDCL